MASSTTKRCWLYLFFCPRPLTCAFVVHFLLPPGHISTKIYSPSPSEVPFPNLYLNIMPLFSQSFGLKIWGHPLSSICGISGNSKDISFEMCLQFIPFYFYSFSTIQPLPTYWRPPDRDACLRSFPGLFWVYPDLFSMLLFIGQRALFTKWQSYPPWLSRFSVIYTQL